MKQRIHLALLAALVPAAAFAQDVNVYSTTMAQMWKTDTPGFDKATYAPVTEFLGIDATKLGTDALSLHLYGWGRTDLKDQSALGGKSAGDLTYGYLQYDFAQANGQIKAGRITAFGTTGVEQLDGVYARTDLKGGFAISAFGGIPVIYKNYGVLPQADITFQKNFLAGARLSYRIPRMGELGVSYLQDGSNAAKDLDVATPRTVDYSRRQVGVDLTLAPVAFFDFTGRTVFDVANHPAAAPGEDRKRVAEQEFRGTFHILENLSATGGYVQRNFYSYYAGGTLPSLFNQNERGTYTATSGAVTYAPVSALTLTADLRHTEREVYGYTTRAGLEGRLNVPAANLVFGGAYHKTVAFRVTLVDSVTPAYSLSHSEMRGWVMYEKGPFSASLDGIRLHFTDAALNPALNGKAIQSAIVGSVGYQAAKSFKVSGDLSVEDTALYKKQVMGLLRAEYRFGFALKGGK
ncbi:hypothetical protein [Mesoterricola sediminis]|uniref:Outer membrane porin, OprD family n=1 Tax=Mesoterricola sediminis TaxID=2927980 RepID=A0AA48KFE8_9BACT|nr:hypothetical protein [Mesoterricola sediminis]BDU78247.1 hypothetical protein METESE_32050 [Mesoterricola sediminis]